MYAVHASALGAIIGLPGEAPVSGLPVFGLTLAAIASQIGLSRRHASGSPPGMSDGPKRAPSSPPETPEPKKVSLPRYFFSRAMVSVQRLLPPSTTMSSGSIPAPMSESQTASTAGPAFTSTTMIRGVLSDLMNSPSDLQPINPPPSLPKPSGGCSAMNWSVTDVVRLYTAT